jgi:hypothetical protein
MDSVSLVLLAATLASLSVAIMLAVRPVAAAMPDQVLDRVRGADPNTKKASEGMCTDINVNTANSPPPGPNPPYVNAQGCQMKGQPCILCRTSTNSYMPALGNQPIQQSNPQAVDCNPSGGTGLGSLGSCELVGGSLMCNQTGNYDCNTNGIDYPKQTSPP